MFYPKCGQFAARSLRYGALRLTVEILGSKDGDGKSGSRLRQ